MIEYVYTEKFQLWVSECCLRMSMFLWKDILPVSGMLLLHEQVYEINDLNSELITKITQLIYHTTYSTLEGMRLQSFKTLCLLRY